MGIIGAMGGVKLPQRPSPEPRVWPAAPLLEDLEPHGAVHFTDEYYSAHAFKHRSYIRVNKIFTEHAYLVDSHFHLDKICTALDKETNSLTLTPQDTSICPHKGSPLLFARPKFRLCLL